MSSKEPMLKRLKLECSDKSVADVVELNLDNCKSNGEPEGLDESYAALSKLSMNSVGFTSLKNFPKLPKLTSLELSDNRIAGSLSCLKHCSNLTSLNLSGNKIKTIDALEPLADLGKLISLDLYNCDVTQTDGYRAKVFELIPSLKYLDGFDCDMKEKEESDDDEEEEEEEENGGKNGQTSHEGENGADDDDEDDDFDSGDDDDDDDESGEEEEDEKYGLSYLTKENLEDEEEEDDEDFEAGEEEDDDDIAESDEELDSSRGVKRKLEGEAEEED